jgi:hypothetical protein
MSSICAELKKTLGEEIRKLIDLTYELGAPGLEYGKAICKRDGQLKLSGRTEGGFWMTLIPDCEPDEGVAVGGIHIHGPPEKFTTDIFSKGDVEIALRKGEGYIECIGFKRRGVSHIKCFVVPSREKHSKVKRVADKVNEAIEWPAQELSPKLRIPLDEFERRVKELEKLLGVCEETL